MEEKLYRVVDGGNITEVKKFLTTNDLAFLNINKMINGETILHNCFRKQNFKIAKTLSFIFKGKIRFDTVDQNGKKIIDYCTSKDSLSVVMSHINYLDEKIEETEKTNVSFSGYKNNDKLRFVQFGRRRMNYSQKTECARIGFCSPSVDQQREANRKFLTIIRKIGLEMKKTKNQKNQKIRILEAQLKRKLKQNKKKLYRSTLEKSVLHCCTKQLYDVLSVILDEIFDKSGAETETEAVKKILLNYLRSTNLRKYRPRKVSKSGENYTCIKIAESKNDQKLISILRKYGF